MKKEIEVWRLRRLQYDAEVVVMSCSVCHQYVNYKSRNNSFVIGKKMKLGNVCDHEHSKCHIAFLS